MVKMQTVLPHCIIRRVIVISIYMSNKCIESNTSSISGVSFKTSSRTSWLYVATTNQILVFNLAARDKEVATPLDNIGCPPGKLANSAPS